ncbi:MFS transporter [Nevskia soli]|jgi:PAT family beta-lactamase induction signal transducer AmpG|uniref:MFS transporter n=1 Tax=Nevskia soli TaxID=418856 RepID=UPI0015D83F5E|nr:MFS transporter [Nevskia soli]
MGLSNSSVGLNSGIAFFVVPQLLAARHVPEATIAGITAAAMSSNFWPVVFGPMLDVWVSRRFYATVFAAVASILVVVSMMNLEHRAVLVAALVCGAAAAMLCTTALCGWLSTVCPHNEKNKLSAWVNIAVISGTGVTSVLGGEMVGHLTLWLAASLLGALVFLPTAIFLLIPSEGPDKRLAGESFGQFFGEIGALLRRREVLVALLLLLSPCSSFALTNLLGGLGADFHASARVVSLAGGAGAFFPGILGCLLFPIIARRLPLLLLYLADGILGSLFTLSLILLPHTPATFTIALVGEYLFQAVAFSIQVGIMFETIGQHNPLAATTFTLLSASTYVPITYMMVADGSGYSMTGIAGSLGMDAAISVASCLLIGFLLYRLSGKSFHLVGRR